jgi:hypothetical protein
VVKHLYNYEYVAVRSRLVSREARYVTLTRNTYCHVCDKKIADSAFAVLPDNRPVHFHCQRGAGLGYISTGRNEMDGASLMLASTAGGGTTATRAGSKGTGDAFPLYDVDAAQAAAGVTNAAAPGALKLAGRFGSAGSTSGGDALNPKSPAIGGVAPGALFGRGAGKAGPTGGAGAAPVGGGGAVDATHFVRTATVAPPRHAREPATGAAGVVSNVVSGVATVASVAGGVAGGVVGGVVGIAGGVVGLAAAPVRGLLHELAGNHPAYASAGAGAGAASSGAAAAAGGAGRAPDRGRAGSPGDAGPAAVRLQQAIQIDDSYFVRSQSTASGRSGGRG